MGMSFAVSTKVTESLTVEAMRSAPVIYLTLLLPIVATYGIAAAAWTGWSWWRVPIATLSGAALALGFNAWAMSQWIARQGWEVDALLSATDARVGYLLVLAVVSAAMLIATGLTMFKRWETQ